MGIEPVTELELVVSAVAPRVTNEQVEAFIRDEQYFSAYQGAVKALYVEAAAEGTDPSEAVGRVPEQLRLLTFCVLTLANGFIVTGESACADAANFNADIGKRLAREQAKNKIWGLLGFELRSKLNLIERSRPASMDTLTTHIGTKVVHAAPMTRWDYNSLRGWDMPANENGADEGYLVEYADGSPGNVVGFSGYVSWSPKDVFERSYGTGSL